MTALCVNMVMDNSGSIHAGNFFTNRVTINCSVHLVKPVRKLTALVLSKQLAQKLCKENGMGSVQYQITTCSL
jgi:hypothetical protein